MEFTFDAIVAVNLAIGILVGATGSWIIAGHYHRRASTERPAWAQQDMERIEELASKGLVPADSIDDYVAALDEALNGKVIDGGTF